VQSKETGIAPGIVFHLHEEGFAAHGYITLPRVQ
jgi:hypothetical protein